MTKRTVLYLRVSTLDQRTSNQELELRQVAVGCWVLPAI
jgi:DNA invertase Pin-like site-specific DNA recombinase